MNESTRSMTHSNASIISMLQRFSDIFSMLVGMTLVGYISHQKIDLAHGIVALVCLVIFQMIGGMTDFYRSWRGVSFRLELQFLLRNWLLSVIFTVCIITFIKEIDIALKFYVLWFFLSLVLFVFFRTFIRVILGHLRKMGYNNREVVMVGDLASGIHLAESIKNAPWLGLNLVGYFSTNGKVQGYDKLEMNHLGNIDELIAQVNKNNIDRVYIALPMEKSKEINYILSALSDSTCTVMLIPDIFTFNVLHSRSEMIYGVPVISLYDTPMSGVNMVLKRIEDIIFSTCILLFISPVLLTIALIIKVTSPGPILFKQLRYGIDGRAIKVWKFRSMTVMENGDKVVQAKKGDSRITPFGSLLRRTSLDELPQFFNVITGDMSIVGPRPHAVAHNEQYRKLIKGYMLRHKMKPGITGWAQINGWRGETDVLEKMEKRVEYDLYYIQNWSLWMDLKIIFLTVFKGFINKSAY
ncbi:undecaprenyl-phosphate glucose phosphotransferase [Serratia sp. MYb239]|uniref:undecaprenyl-phosphate glucose phosphotransferase n=1 Tax=Serratia sp. MYb239 TaxID=2033438 RepID=UPI000CF72E81|nr:undecaprenyl-phosphate glucose phosphotransferase [Serratia sp. MYb239]AVJ16945.1 undecaprenyl-phosphate glucose phosphotransferase [Serratia sp. MYb239]MCA4823577.1 undecaprenyl-phosphate glucose phosphotransferase [Serratia rubidaea]